MLHMYRQMQRIRQFEEKVNQLFLEGRMPGTLHLYTGQEACAVGVAEALDEDDWVVGTHRPHGHAIAKGVTLDDMMAELFAQSAGCARGYGGSMHVGDPAAGVLPAIAIVGGNIPVASGMALGFKLQKTGQVIADECPRTGGWAGEAAAVLQEAAFGSLDAPIMRVTAPDTPVPFAPVMEKYYIPDENDVKAAVREVLRWR
jgi:hypothetical protein